jgi:hypothetical protein
MKLLIEKEYQYIPEWNGNKKDDKPIVFNLRALTEPDRDKVITQRYVDGKLETTTNRSEACRLAITGIDNLNINGVDVKTAKDFLSTPGVSGLIAEIATEVIINTAKKDLGN